MTKHVTISAKVPKELRDKARELGINISEVVRKALQEEVKKRMLEEIKRRRDLIAKKLEKIPDERIVQIVRETREEN